ncbi:alpha-ketoglutarate-dependent dioxygenase AlkB [Sediminibacterium sp.]|uniref:alpha-ketoglutarate-dependent dioxygenase AlkB family protein n=1 Tax=Sediminibacterium sp. TaxID=1917865 RepID=UPI0027350E63|nr:alpha-ketoglutarate-dependent dioxygenase AlkB [Sediminibacterium sp.]MDP3393141.1 alpha-ketoglutarate-dependent dioxygenase AlkB [Sediminibacterium sp.]MDP3567743.1 alpha-ketoglutarate-dependent dioxygenase AlkB [Sediminibacterium sp.]
MSQFNLFNQTEDNILPKDGIVQYYGTVFNQEEANNYLLLLLKYIEWKNDEVKIFGKQIITKRKVAWYGSKPFLYRYSNTSKTALPFTTELFAIKAIVEKVSNETYNSCLLNLYHHGEEGMGWHSDAEPELKPNGAIASISFGAERKFNFKHKITQEKKQIILQHGSLLVMKGTTQSFWQHQLPPSKLIKDVRINLTFRTIQE